jgi:hypothetical protein
MIFPFFHVHFEPASISQLQQLSANLGSNLDGLQLQQLAHATSTFGGMVAIFCWWFGTFGLFFHSVGNFIVPTDELHHFSEG